MSSWENLKEWREKVKMVYGTVIPAPSEIQKKSRQLDEFFTETQEIFSEEDYSSSEGMSPRHNNEIEDQVVDILIHSDE